MLTKEELLFEIRNLVKIETREPSEKLIEFYLEFKNDKEYFKAKNELKIILPNILKQGIEKFIEAEASHIFSEKVLQDWFTDIENIPDQEISEEEFNRRAWNKKIED